MAGKTIYTPGGAATATGGWKRRTMQTFEINRGYFTIWDGKTKYDYHVLADHNYDGIPEPEVIYEYAKRKGLNQEQIIDLLLSFCHRDRIFKFGYLADLSLVVGFVGPRGSGKSCGAAGYAIVDYMLAGKTVWSNMLIEFKVKYKDCEKIFRSEPLDKASLMDINDFENKYADGLIMIDELNIEIGDARRSMSNQMLWFDFMLQEVRKRKMNICYQLQAEEWAGSRSRWQTDIYVGCIDYAFLNGKPKKENIGRFSRWKLYDMSGIITGEIKFADGFHKKVQHFNQIKFWNTPFWNAYDTTQMQVYQKFDPSKVKRENGGYEVDKDAFEALTSRYLSNPEVPAVLLEMVNRYANESMLRSDIYKVLSIEDHREISETGELLRKLGFTDGPRLTNGRSYIVPDKDLFLKRLNELGVQIISKN